MNAAWRCETLHERSDATRTAKTTAERANGTDDSATRRDFLRDTLGTLSAASVTRGASASRALSVLRPAQKTILVTFGGNARDEETFAEGGQENIPDLLGTLLPQGTFLPVW